MNKRTYRGGGFTLIEALTVAAIFSILMGLIIFTITQAQRQARDAKRKSDLVVIGNAFELRYQDKTCQSGLNIYPGNGTERPPAGGNQQYPWSPIKNIVDKPDLDICGRPFKFYLSQVPSDPRPERDRPYKFNLSAPSLDKSEVTAGRYRLAASLEKPSTAAELAECKRQSSNWENNFNGYPYQCDTYNYHLGR